MIRKIKRIDYSKKFLRQLRKSPLKINKNFKERLTLFIVDPFYPQLNNHQLTGKYTGLRSLNITGDWRVIFQEYKNEDGATIIVFLFIGTHSQLYR